MADIRLVRPRGSQVWLVTGAVASVALVVWAVATFFGDPTQPDEQPRIGAAADFGANRAPVIPAQPTPLGALSPLRDRDLGRLVQFSAVTESRVVDRKTWVRTEDGRRILLRFDPEPPEGALGSIAPGRGINMEGYLARISEAEFKVWLDTLNVSIPRPPPGRKFGDLPSQEFLSRDSMYVKTFYISVRPEGINPKAKERPEAAVASGEGS